MMDSVIGEAVVNSVENSVLTDTATEAVAAPVVEATVASAAGVGVGGVILFTLGGIAFGVTATLLTLHCVNKCKEKKTAEEAV